MAFFRVLLVALVTLLCASQVVAQGANQGPVASEPGSLHEMIETAESAPIRTESPRNTLQSLYQLRDQLEASLDAYWQQQNRLNAAKVTYEIGQMSALIDLSQVPSASRRETGEQTAAYLLDILGRIKAIDAAALPGPDDLDDQPTIGFRLPGTPLRIVEITEGNRAGEYLFSADTVHSAPRFFAGLRSLPLRSSLPITSWEDMNRQLTGPWIPSTAVAKLPNFMKLPILDTSIWKILFVILISGITAVVLRLWNRLLVKWLTDDPIKITRLKTLSPIGIMMAVLGLQFVFSYQVNINGRFFNLTESCIVVVFYIAATGLFWTTSRAFFETVIVDPRSGTKSLDDSFIRLVGKIIGVIGGILILGYGAQKLGVPVLSVIAGFGIGGIAVALAVRPTLENLIGGFILFIDKPVRVGDYCTFGDKNGTVENIGVRSTQLRALDRTLISIPNAQFADMQIVNWAKCDTMLIQETLGLRFETDAEQMRYVLAKIREMLYSHPRIEAETIRVRFMAFGDSSKNIDLRIYAKTREWNDFYSIKEDILLRIDDIVDAAGTGFAFPSQTLYWSRDTGLDTERTEQAHKEVATWRRRRELPFPRFSSKALEGLSDKLKYPPPGSPDYFATDEELAEGGETLSADQPQDPVPESNPDEKSDKSDH